MLAIGHWQKRHRHKVQTIRYYETDGLMPEPDRHRRRAAAYKITQLEPASLHPAIPPAWLRLKAFRRASWACQTRPRSLR